MADKPPFRFLPPKSRPARLRPWVQLAFAAIWLAPVRTWTAGIPSCVFHCYACPLVSLSCPVGLVANYATWHIIPWLTIAVVFSVAALVGSLVCGWMCPFGALQDLFNKIPGPKISLPKWTGYGRYVVLVGVVIVLPYVLGGMGIAYDDQVVSICRECPAGAVEAAVPRQVMAWAGIDGPVHVHTIKWVLIAVFLVSITVIYRPWCKVLCPLGGFLALFNRFSFFQLHLNRPQCINCNLCHSRCSMDVEVTKAPNSAGCIRCLDCIACGALTPSIPAFGKKPPKEDEPGDRV